jgi:hypothetical protein
MLVACQPRGAAAVRESLLMKTRIFGLAALASVALLAGGVGQASAATCSGEVTTNGTTTLPGTSIGAIASGCEIGPYNATLGQNGTGIPTVNPTDNPSVYLFQLTAATTLSINVQVGNNGTGNNINVELGYWGTNGTSTSTAGLTFSSTNPPALSSDLASTFVAYQSGPTTTPTEITETLAAGWYVLDTYLGTCVNGANNNNCSNISDPTDPQFQDQFVIDALLGTTPLPATLPMFAGGLGFVGYLAKRRKQNARKALVAA